MIGFKRYITESDNLKGDLAALRKYLPLVSEKQRAVVEDHINTLIKAVDEKVIFNARYVDASKGILGYINRAYNVLEKSIADFRASNRDLSEKIPYSIYTVSDIKKAIKDTANMHELPANIRSFFNSIKGLPDALAIIKGYTQKGREPKPVDPNKPGAFVRPMASFDASRSSITFMKEAATSFEKELRESISKQVMTSYEKAKEFEGKSPFDVPKDMSMRAIMPTIFVTRTKAGKQYLEFIPNHEDRLEKLINDNVTEIIDGFVGKSATKLALILEKKGMPKTHTIVKTNVRNGMVENTMKFEFEDGSGFTLESSVVYKYSQMGKLFFQYPTRFKNVRLADGSMMKMPSEKKMIEEF